jgi:hypothetical protein
MKAAIGGCLLSVLVSACAGAGDRRDAAWEAARAGAEAEQQAGRTDARQTYAALRQQYGEIYGSDAGAGHYFAYAGSLMASAQRGDIDMREARMLVAAKEQEALHHARALRIRRERYSYPEN